MKTARTFRILFPLGALIFLGACINNLDVKVADPDQITADQAYGSVASYEQALAKVYAGLALSGQKGPTGDSDIAGIDEGFGQYLRGYWQLQELPTDEAIVGWSDVGLPSLNYQTGDVGNVFVYALYSRVMYQVTLANQFIAESSPEKAAQYGIASESLATIALYQTEARWLRALSYSHGLDLFGNPPFVTEADGVGKFLPNQTNKQELFKYVEKELLDIENKLAAPKTNEYGRVDRAAAWALLARLYLNAEVYVGEPKYKECMEYCDKIIGAGYALATKYQNLFLADNDKSEAKNEIIFAIPANGQEMKTWGGVTFITNASSNSDNKAIVGVSGGWAGLRARKSLVNKYNIAADSRADAFDSRGHDIEINDVTSYTNGYALLKFRNMNSDGTRGESDISGAHASIDFPLFRLADVYLTYAEAALRGGGDRAKALGYVNKVRTRAYTGNVSGAISDAELTLDFLLDERARELCWEAMRRTDLIRYKRFTGGTYLWTWKGGTKEGVATDAHLDLYPIPSNDLTANPKLKQNAGY